jgi:hypothetical protein
MKNIRETNTEILNWLQPSALVFEYHLQSGDDLLAILKWQKLWGSLASAQSADGKWTFKRQGFFHPSVTIRSVGSDSNIAVFHPNWIGNGILVFSDGKIFKWNNLNFWHNEWAFTSDGKQPVHFKPKFKLTKLETQVEIDKNALTTKELSLLVILGWYLMVLMSFDASSSAAVVAATGH